MMVSSFGQSLYREPLCLRLGVTCLSMGFEPMSASIASPLSLVLAHASDLSPLTASVSPLCHESLQVAARPLLDRGLSRRYLRESFTGCLDPYPGGSHWCTYPFLPRGRRPSPRREWLGTQQNHRTATSVRVASRGYSHSVMFRPPALLATQVAPTVIRQLSPAHQAAVAFTFTHISVCFLPEQ